VFSDMTLYALVDVSDEYAASIFGVEDIFFWFKFEKYLVRI
jgi:hypothetical protein